LSIVLSIALSIERFLMAKGGGGVQAPSGGGDNPSQVSTPGAVAVKRRKHKEQNSTAASLGRQAAIGGPSNALKSGKMAKPMIDTSRFKIKKRSR
jgi:hypothetical protein